MELTACPRCQLPKDNGAWQCDGCGHVFAGDFEQVHATLKAQVRGSRVSLLVTTLIGIGVIAGIVILALYGFFYIAISVPLPLVMLGGIGHAFHRTSVLHGHLQSLERRLPKATANSL